jgi:hypothetical protein
VLPVGLAVGGVLLLLWRGMNRALAPVAKETSERNKLATLKAAKRLTLDQAEDGLVLARRYGDVAAGKWFGTAVVELRKRRVRI